MARMPKTGIATAISAVADKWTGRMAFSFSHTDVTPKPSSRFQASVGLVTSFLISSPVLSRQPDRAFLVHRNNERPRLAVLGMSVRDGDGSGFNPRAFAIKTIVMADRFCGTDLEHHRLRRADHQIFAVSVWSKIRSRGTTKAIANRLRILSWCGRLPF